MTKKELQAGFQAGKTLCDMLVLRSGQCCEIFKAERFVPGDEIIYIPDLWLNDIPADRKVIAANYLEDILDCCYTGDDFIEICGGDEGTAQRLFDFVDWQHPSSAYDAGDVDDEDEE